LVNDFSKRGMQVTGIRVEVQPHWQPRKEQIQKQAKLSVAGAESLEALARRLPDSKLRQAVAEMAARKTR
jgi:hypothetical protein